MKLGICISIFHILGMIFLGFSSVWSGNVFAWDGEVMAKPLDKWTSKDKREFKNQYAYCKDSSWTSPIDLSYQFPRSSGLGSYTALAASADLFSAALSRSAPNEFLNRSRNFVRDDKGKVVLDSRNWPIVENHLHEKGQIDSGFILFENVLKSGSNSAEIDQAWNAVVSSMHAWGCDDLVEDSTLENFVDSESTRNLMNKMMCTQGYCRPVGAKSSQSKNELIKKLVERCGERERAGSKMNKYDFFSILYEHRAAELSEQEVSKSKTDKELEIEKVRGKLDQHDLYFDGTRSPVNFTRKESCLSKNVNGGKKLNDDMMRVIKAYLCSHNPLAASLTPELVPGLEYSKDGGSKFSNVEGKFTGLPRPKHLVLTGMNTRRDGEGNEKAYLELRAAEVEGSKRNPDGSIYRIPVSEVCHLKDMSAIISPEDQKRGEIAGVHLSSSVYSGTRTVDFISKKYATKPGVEPHNKGIKPDQYDPKIWRHFE